MEKNSKERINELFDFAFNNPKNELQRVDLGIISTELAENIAQNCKINVENHVFTVDNYGILHAISEHGMEQMEELRGQIGLKKADFSILEQLIREVDSVELEGENSLKNPILVFETMLEKHYFSVWEVRTVRKKRKKNRLFFVTMYIRKK